MKLHPDVQALSDAMHEVERFLREHEQTYWADEVARSRYAVDQSDAYGLRSFLALFGGMGSLNDLVLSRDQVALQAENDQLHELTARAWKIADRLQREAQ